MKKLMILLLLCSTTVQADNWLVPLFGGVALGTIIGGTRYEPRPYYIVESRQYYQPPATVYYPPNYGGSPYGYHYESIYDGYCGCYKTVLVQN